MVTKRYTIDGVTYIEYDNGHRVIAADYYFCSTDVKPIEGVHNGETGLETDTKKVFIFDESARSWNEV